MVERGRGRRSAVFLADVAQLSETVQVVKTPVVMKVGAVLVFVT